MPDFNPDAPASGDGLFGLPFSPEDARLVVVSVPWQATTSYRRGTNQGPANIRNSSLQVDLFDIDYGDAWRAGIAQAPENPVFRALDTQVEPAALEVIAALGEGEEADPALLEQVNAAGEQLNGLVFQAIDAIFERGQIPALIGGDHSTPFGAIQAAATRHPGLGILHIDAHADLRDAYEGFTWSHASIFHNVMSRIPGIAALTQVGIRDFGEGEIAFQKQDPRITCFFDANLAEEEASGTPWLAQVKKIVATLPEKVWISFDIDGLDPALCPTTGTPVPGGLSWRQACLLIREVSRSRHLIGFDVNEVGPGEWDGVVGARLLYKLCGAAISSHPA